MSHLTTEDAIESITTRRERVKDFARIFGIASSDMEGGSILPKDYPSEERLSEIKDVPGGTIDPANIVGLVFEIDEWGIDMNGVMEEATIPGESYEKYEDGELALKFTSESGSEVFLTTDYVDNISEFIGVDLRENPHRILMNEKDAFPVVIEDTEKNAEIVLAPRIKPDGAE